MSFKTFSLNVFFKNNFQSIILCDFYIRVLDLNKVETTKLITKQTKNKLQPNLK